MAPPGGVGQMAGAQGACHTAPVSSGGSRSWDLGLSGDLHARVAEVRDLALGQGGRAGGWRATENPRSTPSTGTPLVGCRTDSEWTGVLTHKRGVSVAGHDATADGPAGLQQ